MWTIMAVQRILAFGFMYMALSNESKDFSSDFAAQVFHNILTPPALKRIVEGKPLVSMLRTSLRLSSTILTTHQPSDLEYERVLP